MKRLTASILTALLVLTSFGCSKDAKKVQDVKKAAIEITDAEGKTIKMEKAAEKIISLYSAHTENLFSLGLDREIIGVGTSDVYPPAVKQKKVYDYKADPENIIAVKPDLVLIRPFIRKSVPDFVKALEEAGINVVSLYPEKFDEFEDYIRKLGVLTGKTEKAEELLNKFKEDMDEIHSVTKDKNPKVRVYFESTEKEYRTVTKDSMAARVIEIAGGVNIADDAVPVSETSSIASYGLEKIIEKGDKIDVYVSQSGAMNAGGNPHSISIRPGFSAIKAVKENRIYNIDEKLVSSPTFRYAKGIMELARMLYPEIFDDLSVYASEGNLTRVQLAEIAVKYKHKPIFTPSSGYYKKDKKGHVYGEFKDVLIDNKYFDYIETAVLSGYMKIDADMFEPEREVTRQELAEVLFMMEDIGSSTNKIEIKDLNKCIKQDMVQKIVDGGIMSTDSNSCFNPEGSIRCKEAVDCFNRLKGINIK